MTITQLEYALAVQKTKNFVQAAKDCHVSQPTLSMQLKKLEEDLGYMLFDRSRTPILVTPEGENFLNQARVVIHEYKKLSETNQQEELSGLLKIGVIPTLAPYLVPLFVKNFIEKYPSIELTIEENQTEVLMEKLLRDELDGALLATPLKDSRLIEKVLFYEPFSLYLSEDHPLAKKSKIGAHEIKPQDLWLLDQGHCLRNQVLKICSFPRKKGPLQFSGGSLETLIRLVDSGMGMTILPKLAISKDKAPKIKEFAQDTPSREISLVAARSFYKEKLLLVFEETIVDSLPHELHAPKKKSMKVISPI